MDGKVFGQPDHCYLGIFANLGSQSLKDTWVVGNNLMSQKYYFLDMGPFEDDDRAYLSIGIGPINPDDTVIAEHYNPKSNDYMPEDKKNDMSKQIPGTEVDPYVSPQYPNGHKRREKLNSDTTQPWAEENSELLIILVIIGVFILITVIMLVIYCKKHKKIKQDEAKDRGLLQNEDLSGTY